MNPANEPRLGDDDGYYRDPDQDGDSKDEPRSSNERSNTPEGSHSIQAGVLSGIIIGSAISVLVVFAVFMMAKKKDSVLHRKWAQMSAGTSRTDQLLETDNDSEDEDVSTAGYTSRNSRYGSTVLHGDSVLQGFSNYSGSTAKEAEIIMGDVIVDDSFGGQMHEQAVLRSSALGASEQQEPEILYDCDINIPPPEILYECDIPPPR
jgi:hypothetical protein